MKPFNLLVPCALALTIAACSNPAPPADEAPKAEEAAAPAAPAADAAAPAAPAAAIAYACEPAMKLTIRYDNDAKPDGKAIVTLDGKEYSLDHVEAGSGARYETQSGRTPGATLVWWGKGDEGMLLEGKAGDDTAEEKKLASCKPA